MFEVTATPRLLGGFPRGRCTQPSSKTPAFSHLSMADEALRLDPLVEKASDVPVFNGVEVALDVHFDHHAPTHLHQPPPQRFQRLMGRPFGRKPYEQSKKSCS